MCSAEFGQLLLDPRDIEESAAVRTSPPFLDFAADAAGDVIAREQLWRTAGVLVALGVAPSLFFVVGGLVDVERRNLVEHEALAVFVAQHAAFAADAFRNQDAAHAGRPDHAGGMELDELHIHEGGAGAVGERLPIGSVLPTVAGDLVGSSDTAGGEHHGLGAEEMEAAALAVVAERAGDAVAVLEQRQHGVLHEDIEAEMDAMILERSDHFEAGAVADVGEARVAMAAEIALQDTAIGCAIEKRAPGFEFAHAVGRFLGVEFGHAPVVEVLAAAHGVGKVDAPVVAIVHVGERGRDAAFGHDGVGFAEQRFGDDGGLGAFGGRFHRGSQSRPARSDY